MLSVLPARQYVKGPTIRRVLYDSTTLPSVIIVRVSVGGKSNRHRLWINVLGKLKHTRSVIRTDYTLTPDDIQFILKSCQVIDMEQLLCQVSN